MFYALAWLSETGKGGSPLPVPPLPIPDADFHFFPLCLSLHNPSLMKMSIFLTESLFLLHRDFQYSLHRMTAAKALKWGREISSL